MEQLVDKAAIEEWPIDRLKPYERNSRQHSAEQIEQIMASIREWGWTIPILTDEGGMVLAGHGRLLAGKALGMMARPSPFGLTCVMVRPAGAAPAASAM